MIKRFFILYLILLNLFHFNIIENENWNFSIFFFETSYVLSCLLIFIYTIRKNGWGSSPSIFFTTYFAFIGSRILLDFLNISNFLETNLFFHTTLSLRTAHIFLFLNEGILLAFMLAVSFFTFNNKKRYIINEDSTFYKLLTFIFKLFSPLVFMLNIYSLNLALSTGNYLDIFTGEFEGDLLYNLSNTFQIIYNSIYIIFLASTKSIDSLNKYSRFFFLNLIIFSLRGQRGMLLLFFFLFLYVRNNLKKINFRKVIPIVFSLFIFFTLIEFLRSTDSKKNDFEIFAQVKYISLPAEVSLFLIEYNEEGFVNNSTPYLFTPIVDYFNRLFNLVDENVFNQGRTITLLRKSNYLSNQLTYYLNKPSYLAGFGTGSSIVAEFYDLFDHRFFSIFFLIFLIFIFKLEKLSNQNIFYKILWLFFFMSFIYSPRDSFFKFFQNFVPVLLLLLLLKTLSKLYELRIKS